MDDWFSLYPSPRRGRSNTGFNYARQATGIPICADKPYAFADVLDHQNTILIHREDDDVVYRGDVKPSESCAWIPQHNTNSDDEGEDSAVEEQDHRSRSAATTTWDSSPAQPFSTLSSTLASVDFARVSARVRVCTHSPTVTEMVQSPRRLITYSRIDRERIHAARAKAAALVHARRSRRLSLVKAVNDDVLCAELLIAGGQTLVPWIDDMPRPVVDRHEYVIGVVAGSPKFQSGWWSQIVKKVLQDIKRMERNDLFSSGDLNSPLGASTSRIRFGIGFGEAYPAPHAIENSIGLRVEVEYMRSSAAFKAVSDYQNHLYQQFAPLGYANMQAKITALVDRHIVSPAFEHSVFTTTEISSCDVPTHSHKNYSGGLDTMEVITSLGTYDHQRGGHIVLWDENKVIELPSGATVMFVAGSKRYSFIPVARGQERFLFRQFCNAGVLRWIEKGGKSDKEFETFVSPEVIAAWNEKRAGRGAASAKLFTKLKDIFVL